MEQQSSVNLDRAWQTTGTARRVSISFQTVRPYFFGLIKLPKRHSWKGEYLLPPKFNTREEGRKIAEMARVHLNIPSRDVMQMNSIVLKTPRK